METKACLQENATPTYPPKPLGPTAPCGAGDNSCNRSAWLPCLGSWPARRLTGFRAPRSRSSCRPLAAGGVGGMNDGLGSRPDGYKLCMLTAEVTTLPHLGLAKFDHTKFEPIARLNAD